MLMAACLVLVAVRSWGQASADSLIEQATRILDSRPEQAFDLASRAQVLARNADDPLGVADSYQIMGRVFFQQGVYQEALKNLLEAESIYKAHDDAARLADNYNLQGLVYYHLRQPDVAFRYHEEALQWYERLGDRAGMAYAYGCIGHLLEKRQQYAEALSYQQKALQIYTALNNSKGIATILENIGSIYEDQERYPEALDYFQQSSIRHEQNRDSVSLIVTLNNIGDIHRKTGRNKEALVWTQRALAVAKQLGDQYQVSSAYKDLGKIYSQLGDYQQAYQNLEQGRVIYESIYDQDASRQTSLFATLFDIERKNNAIATLEAERRGSQVIKIALASVLLLAVLLAFVIISRQRMRIRKDQQEMRDRQERFDTEQRLMQAELENTQLRGQKLQQELELRAQSLTAHTLHMMGKNKILEDIQVRLQEVLKEDMQEQRRKIKNLLKMIDQNFVHDKDWDDFRHIFEQVHQDFFLALQRYAPDLTAAEIRLAALIRLNLSSKDMAVTLGISSDSLRIARYRLRKKLALQQGQSLTQFILSL